MKAKELFKILNVVDPESEVIVQVGKNDEYRELCAKAELVTGECLGVLTVESVEILGAEGGSEMFATLFLEQNNVDNLRDTAEEFDRLYLKRDNKQ